MFTANIAAISLKKVEIPSRILWAKFSRCWLRRTDGADAWHQWSYGPDVGLQVRIPGGLNPWQDHRP